MEVFPYCNTSVSIIEPFPIWIRICRGTQVTSSFSVWPSSEGSDPLACLLPQDLIPQYCNVTQGDPTLWLMEPHWPNGAGGAGGIQPHVSMFPCQNKMHIWQAISMTWKFDPTEWPKPEDWLVILYRLENKNSALFGFPSHCIIMLNLSVFS